MRKIESIKTELKRYIGELENYIRQTERKIRKAPEGRLILSRSNGSVQYYHKTDANQKKGIYIPAKHKKLAENLAQKDYDEKFLKVVQAQKERIQHIISMLPKEEIEDVYLGLPQERKELVKNHILTDEQYIENWLNVSYEGKNFDYGTVEIYTERGERVRSKSEKILADKFYALGIPYRYEFPVKIKGYGIVYPDFTLLNVKKRTEFYFEHFGMMDNPEYCRKAIAKLEEYAKNQILPGKNLLLTFETAQKPLDTRLVEQLLKEFIL